MNESPKISRKDIIELLVRKFSQAGCVCIVGLPGSGKTWLTGELLASLQKNGWNSIILRCRDAWTEEDFYSSLSDTLRLYAGDKEVPIFCHDPEKFLDFLSKRDIKLIIDDFHMSESRKTLDLLEKASSSAEGRVIVTSRTRPKTSIEVSADIFTYFLPPLIESETLEMVDSIFEFQNRDLPDAETKRKICKLSQGHPFSVKAICALLLSGEMTLTKWGGDKKLDEIINHFFEGSFWKSQTKDFRQILKQLSVFRIPVGSEIVRDIAADNDGTMLDRLRDSCLAEYDSFGKISLPMILKSFIREKIPDAEMEELHDRAALLLQKRFGSEPLYVKEIYNHFLFSRQRHAAIDALIKFGDMNLFLPSVSCDLVFIIRNELESAGYRERDLKLALIDQLILQNRFEEAQVEIEAIEGVHRAFFAACIEYYKGGIEAALDSFSLLLKEADPTLKFLLLFKIGMCHLQLGDLEKSREILEEIPKMQGFASDLKATALYFRCNSFLFDYLGNVEKALSEIEQVVGLARENGMKTFLGDILSLKGHFLLKLARMEEAGQVAVEVLKLAEEQGDSALSGTACGLLGSLSYHQGDFRKSIEYRLKSRDFFQRSNSAVFTAWTHADIGRAYLRLGEEDVAEDYFAKALETIDQVDDFAPKVRVNYSYCELLLFSSRFVEALERLQAIGKLFHGQCPVLFTSFNFLMGTALEKLGESAKSRDYFKQYRIDLDSMSAETRKLTEEDDSWLTVKLRELGKIGPPALKAKQALAYELFADSADPGLIIDGLAGNFKDFQKIGMGGMGVVFKALDIKRDRTVAIKVLAEKYRDNLKFIRRFIKRDGLAAQRLDHPGIVRIFEVVEGEIPYIVMEYVEGESFRKILDRLGRLQPQHVARIALQVAEALAYAHSHNIIHRDIKPDNIMLHQNRLAKIMDFGLSKVLDVASMTGTGEVFGTLYYMPPEQLRGGDIVEGTDIYALGVTLYEFLTGTLPFKGNNPEQALYKIFNTSPPPPSGIVPEVSQKLDRIVMKAIEKDAAKRYQNAYELIDDCKVFESKKQHR
ncbi:MAG: protein kinase [Candidatus Wallbacteria bacterium]|nr:protein kinase [Candidatus Wallbacteria bacterium]